MKRPTRGQFKSAVYVLRHLRKQTEGWIRDQSLLRQWWYQTADNQILGILEALIARFERETARAETEANK